MDEEHKGMVHYMNTDSFLFKKTMWIIMNKRKNKKYGKSLQREPQVTMNNMSLNRR